MGAMMGKNAKMDMNKLNKEVAKNTHKERMLNKLQQRKAQAQSNFVLEQTTNPNQFVFKGAESQEKSSAKPPLNDDWLNEPITQPSVAKKSGKKNGKNNKKK
jgi:hypothetical protein